MKKAAKFLFLVLSVLFISFSFSYANWLDDWYDNTMSTSSGINYFEGQKRGYATFGSFSMRLPTRTDYLFSIEKPHLKLGCGGIDLFMGGFSFLNPEYLVQKTQGMLQAAPFIAFDMALNTLCPSCSEILKKAESIIDTLNQIQLSECGLYMPKTVVDFVKNPTSFFQTQAEKNTETAQKKGYTDLFYSYLKKFIHITDSGTQMEGVSTEDSLKGLPVKLKNWLTSYSNTQTGFIAYLASQGDVDSTIAEIFRAYVGDLYTTSNSDKNLFNVEFKQICKEADIKDAFNGGTLYRAGLTGSSCIKEDAQKLYKNIENAITQAYQRISAKGVPPSDFDSLVKNSPVPIYLFLKYAVMTKNEAFLYSIAPDVARGMIYAALLDLSKKLKAVSVTLDYASKGGLPVSEGKEIATVMFKNKEEIDKKIDGFNKTVIALYESFTTEMSKNIQQAIAYLEFMDIVEKTLDLQGIAGVM